MLLFLRHTSASLVIQENADPDVQRDLVTALRRLAPEDFGWVHDTEGPDDMPAHVKTMLSGVSLQIPVAGGEMLLGTWQGIYLVEHRARPHRAPDRAAISRRNAARPDMSGPPRSLSVAAGETAPAVSCHHRKCCKVSALAYH